MDVLDRHYQVKKQPKIGVPSECEIIIYHDGNTLLFTVETKSRYFRYSNKKELTIYYSLSINLKKGDLQCYRCMSNMDISTPIDAQEKTSISNTKNKFHNIEEFVNDGFYRGERRVNYWGVKFTRATQRMFDKVYLILIKHMKNEYHLKKDYSSNSTVSPLFDLLVDFHLDKKNIKGHDAVYHTIQTDYPSTKYLKLNDYKFLPAILDQYGIKSKHTLSEINKIGIKSYSVRAMSYICHLFGDNYIDHIKKINKWDRILYDGIPNKRYHHLKNETEKKNLISLINFWEENSMMDNSLVYSINQLLSTREYLEKKGFDLKFTAKDDDTYSLLNKNWESLKDHVRKGYKVRFGFPEEFIKDIEEPIVINDEEFKVFILKTEQDFILEGHTMKNCMSNQFRSGTLYVYMHMVHKSKRINLQYRRGCLTQFYGKANSSVDTLFNLPIQTLNKKMAKYSDLSWKKEKFDFI